MSQPALDFTGAQPTQPPAAKARRPLIGGRTAIARQASADGAALNAPRNSAQCTRLWTYLEACGLNGATDAEIARDLNWPPNVVTARRNDLVTAGDVVIRWPECRRRSVTTNVKVVVWVASAVIQKL